MDFIVHGMCKCEGGGISCTCIWNFVSRLCDRSRWKPIPVYTALTQHHDKKYSIAYFDFSGSATVKIKSKFSLEKLIVLPNKYGICPSIHQDEAIFN